MLTSSLKLRFHEKLDPIFVGSCGMLSAVLSFLKALFEKKIVINIESKEVKDAGEPYLHNVKKIKRLDSLSASKFW